MTHQEYIYKLLDKSSCLIGSELKRNLVKKFKITDANARQIIHRMASKGIIDSTNPVSFGKGQYAYYTFELSNEDIMKLSLNRPPMHRLLNELILNDGVLSYYECYKVTALPYDTDKTNKSSLAQVIKDLVTLNIIEKSETYNGVRFIMSYEGMQKKDALKNHYNKMKLDVLFMRDIMKWLRGTNLVENFIRYRSNHEIGKGAFENNYIWDAFGFNKATGFNTIYMSNKKSDDKKALVVLDIKISSMYNTFNLDGFYERVQGVLCSSKEKKYKLIPIIFTNEITDEAKAKLLNLGFIHFSLGSIFGDTIFKVIQQYTNIFDLISNSVSEQNHFLKESYSSQLEEAIESILSDVETSGQNINLSNMKGDLFELIIFLLLKELLPGYEIEHSIKLPDAYEYDFVAKKSSRKECIIIEVKGYKSDKFIKLGNGDTKNTVRWFFRKTLPYAEKNMKNIEDYNVKGCYITSAKFDDEAMVVLKKINEGKYKPKNLDVFYDGESLMNLFDNQDQNSAKLRRIVKKYYFIDNNIDLSNK